jgi:hypothetical protein
MTSISHRGFKWTTGDPSNPALALCVDETSQSLHITSPSDVDTDWNVSAYSHPTLLIHSNTTPATDYLKLYHDATNGYVDSVGGNLILAVAGTNEVSLTATALSPATSDGSALGTTALMWGDLFLAEGAVINFNNGNATITHSAGVLTVDGAAMVFNEASADVDFRIESNGNANMFVLDGGLDAIGIGGAAAASQTLTVTNTAINASAGRIAKFTGTMTNGALTDGVGAVEVDLTLAGTNTTAVAAMSSWVNITSGTATAGQYVCANNDGIYEDAAATITNAKLIFGARMHYLAGGSNGLRFPFSLNTNNTTITAIFDCMNIEDFAGIAWSSSTPSILVPFLRDNAGTIRYMPLYTGA